MRRFINPLLPRDPAEAHRVASPLELFTDLCFVVQWLRVAANDQPRRATARRYATGIVVVQLGWVGFICCASISVLPHRWP
jgi:hypothetical protein